MSTDEFGDALSNGSRTDRSSGKTRTICDDDALFTMRYVQRFSPRSVEACAREGILLEELIPVTFEEMDFDPADSPAVRKLRFQHVEQRRQELLQIARGVRQKLVDAKWQPPPDLDKIVKKRIPVDAIQKIVGGATADMIESEKTRLQKLITRHEKELEQLVKAELKTVTREERQKQKELAQKQKEEALARQRQKMKQEILEKARQMQQRRAEEEEKERLKRKQLQQEIYEKAMKAQQEQREREKQRRLEARLKAEERFNRQQEFKHRSEVMNESISKRILSKLQMMQIRDEMRRKKAEEQKRLALEEKMRQAQEKKERVERALSMNQKKMEEKRMQLAQQMEAQSRQLDHFAEHLQANYAEIQKQRREADMKRRKAKEEADSELQRKIHKVLDKNRKAEARKREMELRRLEQQELKKEQQRLRIQDKLMNVERKRRMDEYRRVHIASKIEQDFERSRILQRVKSDMIQERKRNHVLAQIQKEEIVKTFHQLQLSDGHKLMLNNRPQSAVAESASGAESRSMNVTKPKLGGDISSNK